MKREPARRENDVEKLIKKLSKRVRTLRDDIPEMVASQALEIFRRKIRKRIISEVETSVDEKLEGLKQEVVGLLDKGYLDNLNTLATQLISSKLNDKKFYDTYVMKGNKISLEKIMKRYENGWHIVYHGKLKDNDPQMIIMERPKKIEK